MRLAEMKCTACRGGDPGASEDDIRLWLDQLPGWKATSGRGPRPGARPGAKRLTKAFRFRAFADALLFTNKVAALAESEGHHPEIVTAWGRVSVSWWTHAVGGLHLNDFVMAAKTDELYGSLVPESAAPFTPT